MPDDIPTLLLTRPRAQAERFADDCQRVLGRSVPVVISPILTIRPRDVDVDLDGISGVIVTSENGVRALAAQADVAGHLAYCVGDHTAKVAEELGMSAISAGGDVGDLVTLIRQARPDGPMLYVHGEVVRGTLAETLMSDGIALQSLVLYDQEATELTPEARAVLSDTGRVVLPLFSPRSAYLVGQAVAQSRARLAVVALSPAVAEAWSGPTPDRSAVCEHPDVAAMLQTVARIYTGLLA